MVCQLNQIAGRSKSAAAARRRLNQREDSIGVGFDGELEVSTMEISIEPVLRLGLSRPCVGRVTIASSP